jgi:phenylalanyl-tRNA synthetase beta chain
MKSIADVLFMDIKTKAGLQVKPYSDTILSGAAFYDRQGRIIGRAGEVHSNILKIVGLKQPVCYLEIDWELFKKFKKSVSVSFKELPKFPSVRRDLALLADTSVTYNDLEQAALKAAGPLLREVNLFDVYEGKNLPEGKKSYALSYIFRDDEKTLTDEKTDELIKKILNIYEKDYPVSLR